MNKRLSNNYSVFAVRTGQLRQMNCIEPETHAQNGGALTLVLKDVSHVGVRSERRCAPAARRDLRRLVNIDNGEGER